MIPFFGSFWGVCMKKICIYDNKIFRQEFQPVRWVNINFVDSSFINYKMLLNELFSLMTSSLQLLNILIAGVT